MFALELALRYMRSKKRAFVSLGTVFAIVGVALGTCALTVVMSVTGGFRAQFREKVLGVNAHVLVLKYSSDFREYHEVMERMEQIPGVTGVGPFVINPMMVSHGTRTATGVLLKGVDPERMPKVLDLPKHITEGSLENWRRPGAKPPKRTRFRPWKKQRKQKGAKSGGDEPLLKAIQEQIEASERDGGAAAPSGSAPPAPVPVPTGDARDDPLPGPASSSEPTGASDDDDEASDDPEEADDADEADAEDGEDADAELKLDEDAPKGSIVPKGGYTSVLPEEDFIPPELDPDPCADPEAVKKMPGIIIGKTLKETLALELGDCVNVTSPSIGYSVSGGTVRPPVARQFRVIAVFEAGFDQYDSKLVYTDIYEAQAFYDLGDSVTGIEMKVDDIENAKDIAHDVDVELNDRIYRTMDWEELNHGLFTALRIQQILMSLVLALIILVAAFTVLATLIMLVLDKKREIAVLKAMGATNSTVLRAFVYQGALIGVIGSGAGLGLGYAVCKGLLRYGFPLDPKVYFISYLPVEVRPLDFALVGLFALVTCLAGAFWPALFAARLRPADAFRE